MAANSALDAVLGRCLCGGVEFQVKQVQRRTNPAQVLVCNCSMCRKASGSINVAWGAFRRERTRFLKQDTLKSHAVTAVAKRRFCGGCGASVSMDYGEADTIWLSVGLLGDDPQFCRLVTAGSTTGCAPEDGDGVKLEELRYPSGHIFWESRCPLVDVLHELPRSENFGLYVPDCAADAEKRNWAAADEAVALKTMDAPRHGAISE